jgi:uncharacterized protein YodC (DUF2158 family)
MSKKREPFSVGNIVRLKSGGPDMIVEELPLPDSVMCKWFEGKKLRHASLSPEVLEAAPKARKNTLT